MGRYTYRVEDPVHGITYLAGVTSPEWSHSYPGGFQSAAFLLPGDVELADQSRLTISKGPICLFDGQIRDRKGRAGPGGRSTRFVAYGHAILLTDDVFGPKVYADNRISSWQTFTPDGFPLGSHAIRPDPEKFTTRSDDQGLRITPKPSAVFNGQTPALGPPQWDFEGFVYRLPQIGGVPGDDTIVEVTLTYDCQFPTGQWALCALESDQSFSYNIRTLVSATGSGTITFTPMSGCRTIALVLRAAADQAVWPGHVNDGADSSIAHTLEYSSDRTTPHWYPDLNDDTGTKFWHQEGGMITSNSTSDVSETKGEEPFYPDAETRPGGAAKLQFTGRRIELYAQKWSPFGDVEMRLWDASGNLVSGPTTYNLDNATRQFQQQIFVLTPSAGFDTYTLTLRNLGSVGGVADPTRQINIDYFLTGVAQLQPFEDDTLFANISAITVRTTTDAITAERVARDIITHYSDSEIGLNPTTIRLNEAGATLPVLQAFTVDDPVTADVVLDDLCSLGTNADRPLAWAVWEDGLTLEEYDTEGARFRYEVNAADAEVEQEETIQEDFGTVIVPTYRDKQGVQQLGADVRSERIPTEYGGRVRRIVVATDARTAEDAAGIARTYLANHDRPSVRTRITLRKPIRDQGGSRVPLDEVRAGRLLCLTGFRPVEAMIVECTYNAEAQTLSVGLGQGPDSLERRLARLKRQQDKQLIQG